MLRPPHPDIRERILAVGSYGTGKTTSWLRIARWAHDTGSDARFYVMDSDRSISHMLRTDPEFSHLTNIEIAETVDWKTYEATLERYLNVARPQDWIVPDFIGTTWDAVQNWYVDQIYGESMDNFFMNARRNDNQGSALDGWKDWSIINRVHKKWMTSLIHSSNCQIFATAVAEPIRDTDDKALKATFGSHGVRPVGQKHLAHQVHTVLLFKSLAPGEVYAQTVKDRGREPLSGNRVGDFVVDYLVNVARWEL